MVPTAAGSFFATLFPHSSVPPASHGCRMVPPSTRRLEPFQFVNCCAAPGPEHLLDHTHAPREPVGERQRARGPFVDLALEGDRVVFARGHLHLLLAENVHALAVLTPLVEGDPPRSP